MESIALPAFEQPEPVQESAASIHCVDFPKAEQCVLKHILHVNAWTSIYNMYKIVSVIKTLDCCCCVGTAVTTCRRTYQDALRRDSMNRFVPWCRADGSYSPVQCFSSYCYCVNTNGQEISNTRTYIETGKPKCTHTSKSFLTFDFGDNLYIAELWPADMFHASSSQKILFVWPRRQW